MDKENFKKEAKKKIDHVFTMIDNIDAKKNNVKGNVKIEYEDRLSNLKLNKIHLQVKYDELIDASDDKWEEMKNAFNSSTDSFKDWISKITSLK